MCVEMGKNLKQHNFLTKYFNSNDLVSDEYLIDSEQLKLYKSTD